MASKRTSVDEDMLHMNHPLSNTEATQFGANVKRVAPLVMRFLISTGCFTEDALSFIRDKVKFDITDCTPTDVSIAVPSPVPTKRPRAHQHQAKNVPTRGEGEVRDEACPISRVAAANVNLRTASSGAVANQELDLEDHDVEGGIRRTQRDNDASVNETKSPAKSPAYKRRKEGTPQAGGRPRREGAGTNSRRLDF